jgi:tetratricopeptide (TPR) repeat protein
MNRIGGTLLVSVLCFLLPVAAVAASAKVTVEIKDEQGGGVSDALLIFAQVDDPEQTFTVDQNDAGRYEHSVKLAGGAAEWNLTKLLASGFLPVKVSVLSTSPGGDPVQEVTDMALDPGTPVPPIRTVPGGDVRIELTLGDQSEVMARFMEARKQARAEAEAKAAQQAESAIQGAYAEALKLYNAGDVEGSLPHFRQAIEENPDDAELKLTYTRVLYQAKKFDEFEEAAARVLEQDPANTELIMMLYTSRRDRGELSKALDALLMLKEQGARGADLLPHLDYLAKSMGRKKAAIPAWNAILEFQPDNREACVALAAIYGGAGEYGRSDQYLERAVELDPRQAPRLYYDTASALLAGKEPSAAQLERAADLLKKTIALDPGFAAAYKTLALGQWKAGDLAGTRENLEKYLELNPDGDDKEQVEDWLNRLTESE